jgi:proteasome assembly chaperone (PAC2) family protein
MDAVHRFHRPQLRRPVAIIAFEGWNDACEAASSAAAWVLNGSDAQGPFAALEPEEFFNFQEHRPTVDIDGGGTRRLTWPDTRFYSVRTGGERDLIIVVGDEPSFRWKTFSRLVTQVMSDEGVEEVVLLGAYIGNVAHNQPTVLSGTATDPDRLAATGLEPSRYEGPTGIIGVMMEACREVGLPAVSIWAATPHYLAANANPRAMLALVEKSAAILRIEVDTTRLTELAEDFTNRVDEAIADNGDLADYIEALAHGGDDDFGFEEGQGERLDPSRSRELLVEIEEFLRDQG